MDVELQNVIARFPRGGRLYPSVHQPSGVYGRGIASAQYRMRDRAYPGEADSARRDGCGAESIALLSYGGREDVLFQRCALLARLCLYPQFAYADRGDA